jgi:hypothetical protein
LELQPEATEACNQSAWAHLLLENYTAAETVALTALSLDANDSGAKVCRVIAHMLLLYVIASSDCPMFGERLLKRCRYQDNRKTMVNDQGDIEACAAIEQRIACPAIEQLVPCPAHLSRLQFHSGLIFGLVNDAQ